MNTLTTVVDTLATAPVVAEAAKEANVTVL